MVLFECHLTFALLYYYDEDYTCTYILDNTFKFLYLDGILVHVCIVFQLFDVCTIINFSFSVNGNHSNCYVFMTVYIDLTQKA